MTDQEPDREMVRKQLMVMRIIWGALMMGPLIFMGVVFMLNSQRHGPNPNFQSRTFQMACIIFIVAVLPASYFIRRVMYGERNERGTIPMARYSVANIAFWAMNEGAAVFAIACMFLHGQALPFLAYAMVPLINQLFNFPTGGPVQGNV